MGQREPRVAVIEGVRPVIEAIRAGRRAVHRVFLPEAATPGQRELEALVDAHRIPTERGVRPGVLAEAEPYPEIDFEALLDAPGARFLVALDRITDVGNLGSIARTAEVAGAGGLVLEARQSAPINAGAIRASAGALEHLRVARVPNLARSLELARTEGFAVLLADMGGKPLKSLPDSLLCGDLLWVFGSEDRGTRPGVSALADERVGIDLLGRVASLGVAAAAAHLLLATSERRPLARPAGSS